MARCPSTFDGERCALSDPHAGKPHRSKPDRDSGAAPVEWGPVPTE